jgi:hypothetical protein
VTTRLLSAVASALLLSLILSSFGYFAFSADPVQADGDKQPTLRLATIQGQHLPLKTVLAELDRQTSNVVTDQMGDPDPGLDLDLKQVTFWQALDAIADKAGARIDLHPRNGDVALAKRPTGWHDPLISYSGLFRITLHGLAAKLDLETNTHSYTASLEAAWEPHLLPLLLETRPRSLVVRDEAGRALPSDSFASSLAPVDGRTSLPFEVTLPPVARAVGKLSLVEGQLYAVAPTKMLTFAFDSLDQLINASANDPRRNLTLEGVVCRVSKVVVADEHWSVEIMLDYPEGNVKLDSYQSWVVNNEIRLESKDGADRFPSSSYLLEDSTPRHAVLTYHFNDKERMKRGLAEWKLVYRTPALVVKVPIAFSFKDVPLP